jgi:hypothetical protein
MVLCSASGEHVGRSCGGGGLRKTLVATLADPS